MSHVNYPEMAGPRSYAVLGTPLLATTYAELAVYCQRLARAPASQAVEFSNTHIVGMRRHSPEFRRQTDSFDCFAPDGMPLIWCLNWQRAGMRDRVYGPTFMRCFFEQARTPYTHYLLGGSGECGARLRRVIPQWNPTQTVVGSFHGRCTTEGDLGDADQAIVDEINRLSPDFIWLAFGAPKQQIWVHRHKHLVRRGVMLTVGFAFDVHAGIKKDAPVWMQRRGLTWLFRIVAEPRRLATRYVKYNSLFLFYLIWDGLRGRALGPGSIRKPMSGEAADALRQ
jgi:N-acetylglucosaminyldiphosphoundecaprenol N-acetyl-beta-D-mannosaminyltransferase